MSVQKRLLFTAIIFIGVFVQAKEKRVAESFQLLKTVDVEFNLITEFSKLQTQEAIFHHTEESLLLVSNAYVTFSDIKSIEKLVLEHIVYYSQSTPNIQQEYGFNGGIFLSFWNKKKHHTRRAIERKGVNNHFITKEY